MRFKIDRNLHSSVSDPILAFRGSQFWTSMNILISREAEPPY